MEGAVARTINYFQSLPQLATSRSTPDSSPDSPLARPQLSSPRLPKMQNPSAPVPCPGKFQTRLTPHSDNSAAQTSAGACLFGQPPHKRATVSPNKRSSAASLHP